MMIEGCSFFNSSLFNDIIIERLFCEERYIMTKLSVLEWNIQGAASTGWSKKSAFDNQMILHLMNKKANIIILTEFVIIKGWDYFQEELENNGYVWFFNQLSTRNGVLIAVKEDLLGNKRSFIDKMYHKDLVYNENILSGTFKPDFLHLRFPELNVIGVRIRQTSYEDRAKQLEAVYSYISENKLDNLVLAGDFNHGAVRRNGDYKGLLREKYNYQLLRKRFDGYKFLTPQYGVYPIKDNQYSWLQKGTNGYADIPIKEDNIILSSNINHNETTLKYEWTNFSDHALIKVEFNM